jgi:hypothetical protein
MPRNPILEEIYATREKLLAACKGDLHAYVEEARRRTLASGRPIATVKRQPRDAKSDAPATASN